MLKSKLKTTYPTADPTLYIIGNHADLDPIFAGRLAEVAKAMMCKVKLTEGYRSTARQIELYNRYLEYKRTGKGDIKLAAKPGTSWHEFRLAVDTSTQPIRSMNNTELALYGLCKPIKKEGWHIQPIETMGLKGNANRAKWRPTEVEEEMTENDVKRIATEVVNQILKGSGDTPSPWAKEPWNEAKQEGITDGTKPQGYVTREQVITMIERKARKG